MGTGFLSLETPILSEETGILSEESPILLSDPGLAAGVSGFHGKRESAVREWF
jgi:hypothetical protein